MESSNSTYPSPLFFPRCHRPPTTTLASSFLPKATPPPSDGVESNQEWTIAAAAAAAGAEWGRRRRGNYARNVQLDSLWCLQRRWERERARGREGGLERELCLYSEEEGRVKEMRGERENGFFSLFPFPVSAAQNSLIWPRRAG